MNSLLNPLYWLWQPDTADTNSVHNRHNTKHKTVHTIMKNWENRFFSTEFFPLFFSATKLCQRQENHVHAKYLQILVTDSILSGQDLLLLSWLNCSYIQCLTHNTVTFMGSLSEGILLPHGSNTGLDNVLVYKKYSQQSYMQLPRITYWDHLINSLMIRKSYDCHTSIL